MSSVSITAADSGRQVTLKLGDDLIVELAENPTNGFSWAVDAGVLNALRLSGDQFYAGARTPARDESGVRAFRFTACGIGRDELRLKLWREWEGDQSISGRFSVTVRVGSP